MYSKIPDTLFNQYNTFLSTYYAQSWLKSGQKRDYFQLGVATCTLWNRPETITVPPCPGSRRVLQFHTDLGSHTTTKADIYVYFPLLPQD
jgi:hypothetical protein